MQNSICWSLAVVATVVLATACSNDALDASVSQRLSVPLVRPRAEVHDSIRIEAPRQLCATGETFVGTDYDFVLEGNEGYHLLSHADTGSATPVAFLRIPGTNVVSPKGAVVLADCYGDVVRLRVDYASMQASVHSTLPNGLAPANSLPVSATELITGFETRVVPTQQTSDGTVLVAWRCPSCFEPIGSEVPTNSGGEVTIVTGERLAGLALYDLEAFVADGQRITAYQSIGETFVKTVERKFSEVVGDLRPTPGSLLAEIGSGRSLLFRTSLERASLPSAIGPCDIVASDGKLVVAARNPATSCGSRLESAVKILSHGGAAEAPAVIGTIEQPGVQALAIYNDHIYVGTARTLYVYARASIESSDYTPRLVQTLSDLEAVTRLAIGVDASLQPALSVDERGGLRSYRIGSDGRLAARRSYARPEDCR